MCFRLHLHKGHRAYNTCENWIRRIVDVALRICCIYMTLRKSKKKRICHKVLRCLGMVAGVMPRICMRDKYKFIRKESVREGFRAERNKTDICFYAIVICIYIFYHFIHTCTYIVTYLKHHYSSFL